MKQHRFDTVSFIFGALFVLTGLLFAIPEKPWTMIAVDFQWGWLLPVILIALGFATLTPLFRRKPAEVEPLGEPPADATLEDSTLEDAFDELPPSPVD